MLRLISAVQPGLFLEVAMPRWITEAWLAVIGGIVLTLFVAVAYGAPKAQGRDECIALWDTALVARALAMTGHDIPATRAVMVLVYSWGNDQRLEAIVTAIVAAAQTDKSATAGDFAKRVARACLDRQGDMNSVLGTGA